jgi:hypothetical protein
MGFLSYASKSQHPKAVLKGALFLRAFFITQNQKGETNEWTPE